MSNRFGYPQSRFLKVRHAELLKSNIRPLHVAINFLFDTTVCLYGIASPLLVTITGTAF